MATKPLRYRTIPAAIRDTSKWVSIDTSALDDEVRERFERYQSAVTFYLGGGKLKDSAAAAGVSEPSFIDQVNRCVIATADGGVLGWAGLIRGLRVNAYTREADLPTEDSGDEAGYAGAFGKLLREYPSIRKGLDEAIRRGVGTKHIRAGTNTVESIFRLFLRLCKAEEIKASSYPFNTSACGRRSVERYVELKLKTQRPGKPWFGPDAEAHAPDDGQRHRPPTARIPGALGATPTARAPGLWLPSVASSTACLVFQGPRRWITSAL